MIPLIKFIYLVVLHKKRHNFNQNQHSHFLIFFLAKRSTQFFTISRILLNNFDTQTCGTKLVAQFLCWSVKMYWTQSIWRRQLFFFKTMGNIIKTKHLEITRSHEISRPVYYICFTHSKYSEYDFSQLLKEYKSNKI